MSPCFISPLDETVEPCYNESMRLVSSGRPKARIWLPVAELVLIAGMIWFFSSQSAEDSTLLSGGIAEWLLERLRPGYTEAQLSGFSALLRKLAHMAEFALLGQALICLFTGLFPGRGLGRPALGALAAAVPLAALDEGHQIFVSGRAPELMDIGIDTLGALLGVALTAMILYRLNHRKEGTRT